MDSTAHKRFAIALSFAGEQREFVAKVAAHLAAKVGGESVLYDKYYEAEFARTDLDIYLQRLYHDESELIAVFLCADYESKDWCGLEWRAIRELIMKRRGDSIMPLRFDATEIPGLFATDGYVWIPDHSPESIADLILERHRFNANPAAGANASATRPVARRPIVLPASLGALFTGREDDLKRLHESLRVGTRSDAARAAAIIDRGTPQARAVHGLGGVGKTRLAIEYAWRYAEEYTALLFLTADSPASLESNLADLCEPMELPERALTEEAPRVQAVRRWLGHHPGWLLILDNVDSDAAAKAVEALVRSPELRGGHALITARVANWSPLVRPLELDVLTLDDAATYLLARTEGSRRAAGADVEQARHVAEHLGRLALALEQAGAYIAHRRLSFAGYLQDWDQARQRVLKWHDERLMQYPRSVATTWQTSVDQLSGPARCLLDRLAWLGPEPIPESLLDTPVPEISSGEDSDPAGALSELASFSLVSRSSDQPTFTVHRLVQEVTRGQSDARSDPPSSTLIEALGWINAAFVGDVEDVRNWPVLDPLTPHARAVAIHADNAGVSHPTARLMSEVGILFHFKARYAEAEPLMRRALAIDEASYGPDHPRVAIRLNNLAVLLKDTNRLDDAEPLMRRALAIDEASYGRDHPNVAIRLNNLAQLLKATNRLDDAEPLMRRVISIFEISLGENHPNVATALNNLAQLLQATNRLDDAEPLMRRALAIDEASYGRDHPNVAIDLNNLAQLLQDTNRLDDAEPLMHRVLAIDEASYGRDHPNVAIRLNNLAALLKDTNRLEEAASLLHQAVAIFLHFWHRTGHQHPNFQAAVGNYMALLLAMGKTETEAEATIRELLSSKCAEDQQA